MSGFDLSALEKVISIRAQAEDGSYTRQLLGRGVYVCAKKLGEEAVEAVLAAVQDDGREELVKEAADVLYHLLVVLKVRNVALADVYAELARRTGQSGLEEKASRGAAT